MTERMNIRLASVSRHQLRGDILCSTRIFVHVFLQTLHLHEYQSNYPPFAKYELSFNMVYMLCHRESFGVLAHLI